MGMERSGQMSKKGQGLDSCPAVGVEGGNASTGLGGIHMPEGQGAAVQEADPVLDQEEVPMI